jgi:hypothetical protein
LSIGEALTDVTLNTGFVVGHSTGGVVAAVGGGTKLGGVTGAIGVATIGAFVVGGVMAVVEGSAIGRVGDAESSS